MTSETYRTPVVALTLGVLSDLNECLNDHSPVLAASLHIAALSSECSERFIGPHNEALSVAAMRVNNPDRSRFEIKG